MTVHFIGAGPGAADLITVRGRDLIARCPVCLYAGSIVSPELLQYCPPGARIVTRRRCRSTTSRRNICAPQPPDRMSPACIPVTFRSGVRWPSRCAGCKSTASPSR